MWLWSGIFLASTTLHPVRDNDLCITSGHLKPSDRQMLLVRDSRMRAVMRYMTPEVAELRFVYNGPTANTFAFSSGIMRQQIGLKLRAADPCNLLYVMWRITPTPSVVVSIKSNPGSHTSAACGGSGYRNLKAVQSAPPPRMERGKVHRLHAEMLDNTLTVRADNQMVWQGPLDAEVEKLHGPVGVRSDNGLFELQLLTSNVTTDPTPVMAEGRCHAVGEEAQDAVDIRD